MTKTKMDGRTPDIAEENIEKLKQLFPEACCEDKVDFDKLKQVLGDYVDDDTERYNFTWNGKGRALKLSQTPSTGTLRPCKEESKNWDDTENLYIEGDNLEALKLLQKSYYGKIKMIYIDPPYNTGNDFVYKDDFKDGIENYKEITGQVDLGGKKTGTNSEVSGRYHTNWLNMMYPRLRLAKNLLMDDGAIFISIDDNEVSNLVEISDEIFGVDNRVAIICHKSRASVSNDKIISPNHNFILFYSKNISVLEMKRKSIGLEPNLDGFDQNDGDEKGDYRFVPVDGPGGSKKGNPYYEFLGITGYWRFSKETMEDKFNQGLVVKRGNSLYQKYYKTTAKNTRKTATTWWDDGGLTSNATSKLKQLMGTSTFDTPKPVELVDKMLRMITNDNRDAAILDFFSGSATTADATLQLNAEDGGNRKFILVQLPEKTDEKNEAYKAGYKNICEIGKERIRHAGEKIKSEIEEENKQIKMGEEPRKVPDIGFKVFKLDSSNIKKWQPDDEQVEDTLLSSIDNFMPDRTEIDVVYEIMLKLGLDLSYTVEVKEVAGRKIYSIGMGSLMICLDDDITTDVADEMIKLYSELQPEVWKVVFKDNCFKDDSTKINIFEIFKSGGLDEDAFTTI